MPGRQNHASNRNSNSNRLWILCCLAVLVFWQAGYNISQSLSEAVFAENDHHHHHREDLFVASLSFLDGDKKKITTNTTAATEPSLLSVTRTYEGPIQSRTTSSTTTTTTTTSKNACAGYAGILHIQHGDKGAAGTAMFFAYVINYLRYAQQNNLLPWIHLDQESPRVYDPAVHGNSSTPSQSIVLQGGTVVGRKQQFSCAKQQIGPIVTPPDNKQHQKPIHVTVHGNGVWETYFQPVSEFNIAVHNCPPDTPYVTFTEQDQTWMHYRWPDAVRVWQYMKCSKPLQKPGKLHEWYGVMRRRAQPIVSQYFHPQPWLLDRIQQANPMMMNEESSTQQQQQHQPSCLAMHVRLTDKSGRDRALIGVDAYWPYVKAYAQVMPESHIYLASDSQTPLQNMTTYWPPQIVTKIRTLPGVLQSTNATAVFDLGHHHHHRTNTEILTDVYAMARCHVFLHGHSGVSEAVHYINANLHDCSVDLEDPDKPSVAAFREMLQRPQCNGRGAERTLQQ